MKPLDDEPRVDEVTESYSALELARMISDASINQTFALDTKLRVISWNTACERVTGITRTEALGAHFTEVRRGMDGSPAVAEAMRRALQGFKTFVPWEDAAYGSGYYEYHFVPLHDRNGNTCGVLVIMHDVAHRIKAEQELKRLNKALVSKNRQLKRRTEDLAQFNWIASHDLKEPLRKIYMFIEMAATKGGAGLSDTARTNLRRAQGSVQRMGLLTDDIVNFSAVASPNEKLEKVELEDVLDASKQRFKKAITYTVAVVESVPLPAITGYPKMLRLLLDNMLENALKFHKEGEHPRVHISYQHQAGAGIASAEADADAVYHCLSFADHGIGINPQFHEIIFGMFQRLHPKESYKGTGMGLPICSKVAEAHEGFITVDSNEGAGATFTCYLKDMGDIQAG